MAATKQARFAQPPAASRRARTLAKSSTPKGFRTEEKSSIEPGVRAVETIETAATAPAIQARGRQRGEGSLPVGKSIIRKSAENTIENCARVDSQAATAPPGVVCEWSAVVAYCPER